MEDQSGVLLVGPETKKKPWLGLDWTTGYNQGPALHF